MKQQDYFERILRWAIAVLGIWGLYAQVSVLMGRTFRELLSGMWIPVLAIALLTMIIANSRQRNHVTQKGSEGTYPETRLVITLAFFSITGMLIFRPGNLLVACVYVLSVVLLLAMMGDRVSASTISRAYGSAKHQTVIVLLVIVAAMVVTLFEHRVNWDDANYLHKVANTLENQDQPMLVYDNLHGIKDLKINHPGWRLQTYELLVASIAEFFDMNHLVTYYLILPPIWAALAVMAQWALVRRLAGKHAALALITTFLLLTVWGNHRSYGTFSFDFAGRGIFLTFAVPALISATLDFAENSNFRSWCYLFLAVWTGGLFSSAAYAIAPVAVCLVLIVSYGISLTKIRDFGIGLLAIIWCPLLMAYVVLLAPIVPPVDVDTPGGVHTVFKGAQGRIALVLFSLAPFFSVMARLQNSKWLLRYSALSVLLLFNAVVLEFIGKHHSGLSWRILWAVPVPVIIGVGLAASIDHFQKRFVVFNRLRWVGALVGLSLITTAFAITGNTVVFRNFGWPSIKVDTSAFPVARSLVKCSKPEDLMLAPTQIAVPTVGLIGAPSLIAVRGHFLSRLSAQWGDEESRRRKRLFNIVHGKRNAPEDILWIRNQIISGSINRIVVKRKDKELDPLKDMFRSLKLNHVVLGNWEVWLPRTSTKEAMELRSCLDRTKDRVN